MDSNNSRRNFLRNGLVLGSTLMSLPPTDRLLNMMVDGFIQKAQATELNQMESRYYVQLLLYGAPPRFCFDHWMRTSPTDPAMQFNHMIATKYTMLNGAANGVEYGTFNYRGVLVPHMFSQEVYSGTGSRRPLTDLLDEMLVIRGYGTGLDGHPTNVIRQVMPVGGVSSLSGLAADYSSKIFSAVQWPNLATVRSYQSKRNQALNILGDGNAKPLTKLMAGLKAPPEERMKAKALKERNQQLFTDANRRLEQFVNSGQPGSQALKRNLENARALMQQGAGDIEGYWTEATTRYRNLMTRSMQEINLPGISDMTLTSTADTKWGLFVSGQAAPKMHIGDFKQVIQSMRPREDIVGGFALAEYMIKNNLGTSVEIGCDGHMMSCLVNGVDSVLVCDQHELGSMSHVAVETAFWRGIAAAILELRSKLKGANDQWSQTVFQTVCDFGRSARSERSGFDHGFDAMITSVISGAFTQGPSVVGNIKSSGYGAQYRGTQGIGTAIVGYNQRGRPTPVMAASTVAAFLGIGENPYKNVAEPLVVLRNGRLEVVTPGKLVEEG